MSRSDQAHTDESEDGSTDDGRRCILSAAAGSSVGRERLGRAANARLVKGTIERTYTRQALTASGSDFARQCAGQIRDGARRAAETGTHAGARECVKGHFVEALDITLHNAKGGSQLVLRPKPDAIGYDATRFVTENGKIRFAGGVQQKANATGTAKAIAQMERIKPGSASRGTLRVPRDQVEAARRRATGSMTGKQRIRVQSMDFTTAEANKRLDQGLSDIAKHGAKAGSRTRALAKGGAVGAAVSVGIGGAMEARALRRGDVSGREFAENRVVDAAEGATNAVVGTFAAGAGAAMAARALTTAPGASIATAAGVAGSTALGTVGGMGTVGAAVAGTLGGVTAAAALPVVAGGVMAMGTGVVVGSGFKRARRRLKAHQQQRRQLEGGTQRQLPPGPNTK